MPMNSRLLRPLATRGLDADASTYIAAVEAADTEPLEQAVRIAINDFVVGCKSDGIWSAFTGAALFMGARTLSGALTPLVGGDIANDGAFVSGDYSRKLGLLGDGGKYLRPATTTGPTGHNNSFSTYQSAGQSGVKFICGWNSSNALLTASGKQCRSASGTLDTFSDQTSTGFVGVSRSGSSGFTGINGGVIDSFVRAAAPDSTLGQYGVFAVGDGTAAISTSRLAFYHCGFPLDLALLNTRVTNLYNAIGAAI